MTAPIRVALAGYGLAGAVFHAPLITATPGLRLDVVATRDPGRATQARAAHPGVRVVDDVRTALHEVDLLVVATANRAHVALADAGLAAGTHVVVDKPIAITAHDAAGLVTRARDAGRLLIPFHNRRFDADLLTLRRLLHDGRLGRLVRLESRFCRWRPQPRTDFWRESADPEDGGGLLLDLGTHLVDQALLLMGDPVTVYAEVARRRGGTGAEDDVFIALGFPDGAVAHIWASALAADPGPRLRALGTEGGYLRMDLDGQEDALRAGRWPRAGRAWDPEAGTRDGWLVHGDQRTPVPSEPGAWPAFYAGVARAIRDGAPPPVDPGDAVRGLRVLEAARRSAAQSEIVRL